MFDGMERLRPCAACAYKKCYESSLWLGCYYYTEGEFEKAAVLLEEASVRYGNVVTQAKLLLEKIKNGDCGVSGKSDGHKQDAGQKQGIVARLFHRKTDSVK